MIRLNGKNGNKGRKDDTFSFLGKDIMFTGKINSKGTIAIEGHLKGEVSSIENLIVGKGAIIESNLDVSSVVLHGEVRGNINACATIKILSTGKVYGDILSPSMIMEPGAVVDGKCTVTSEPALKKGQTMPGGSKIHTMPQNGVMELLGI